MVDYLHYNLCSFYVKPQTYLTSFVSHFKIYVLFSFRDTNPNPTI